jgi:cytoskeletal protein CcmA (bactofilin family)
VELYAEFVRIRGSTNVEGNLSVDGSTALQNDVWIGGNATLQNDVWIGGNATLDQDVWIGGQATFQQSVTVEDNILINGNATLQNGNLTVDGQATFQQHVGVNQSLTVSGSTDLQGVSVKLSGLVAPALGDALVAQTTTGEVKWASPSQYVSGIAVNPGKYLGTNIRQVIFTDPTSAASANGGCWIVPMDITVEKIFIKWVGVLAPDIASGEDLTWDLGRLTSNTGTSDTDDGAVNFTSLGADLSSLTIDDSQSANFFYKESGSLSTDFSEGEILVLRYALANSSWVEDTYDVTVTVKYRQRYS